MLKYVAWILFCYGFEYHRITSLKDLLFRQECYKIISCVAEIPLNFKSIRQIRLFSRQAVQSQRCTCEYNDMCKCANDSH